MNKYLKSALYVVFDCVWVVLAWVCSIRLLRYDIGACMLDSWYYLIGCLIITVTTNLIFKLYNGLWRFAGFSEAIKIICAERGLLFASFVEEACKEKLRREGVL